MIPKIIHQIWVGKNIIPEQEKKWSETWRHFFPNYEYILWTEKNLPSIIPENCSLTIDSVMPKYALVADVYRYLIMYKYGGIYADTDIECYKNFDNIFLNKNFVGITPHENTNYLTNAFFACSEKNEILKMCIEDLKPVPEEGFKTAYAYIGPSFLTKQFCKFYEINLSKNHLNNIELKDAKILNCKDWYDKSRNEESYMKHYFRASHIHVTK
jgi:mannosyltransferase OCH1-like enzyme